MNETLSDCNREELYASVEHYAHEVLGVQVSDETKKQIRELCDDRLAQFNLKSRIDDELTAEREKVIRQCV